jgi:translation initiation factor 1 (eIF-1/SUI1)
MRLIQARLTGLTAVVSLVTAVVQTHAALAAVSVTNRDEKDHQITIIEGEKKQEYTLKPNQALENICAQGCVLRLNNNEDDDYQLEPKDVVSIEDGALYYDNESEAEEKPEDAKKK